MLLLKKLKLQVKKAGWRPISEPVKKLSDTIYEITMIPGNGVYEYKYVIDGKWYPEGENLKLILGERGELFPKGYMGDGKFVYDTKEKERRF